MQAATLRAQIESALGVKLSIPLIFRQLPAIELLPSGCELDALTGGLPRGSLTEIYGPASSGHASVGLSVLAQLTARGEACAWVDASDSLDPYSAEEMGAALHRLLWVRCRGLEQAIQTADLLLGSAGFGLVVLDLAGVPPETLHRLPLSFWFRFRLAIEHTPTLLLVLTPEACAKSCASLVLRLQLDEARWSITSDINPVSHSYLLQELHLSAEVIRSRLQWPSETASSTSLKTAINYQVPSFEAS